MKGKVEEDAVEEDDANQEHDVDVIHDTNVHTLHLLDNNVYGDVQEQMEMMSHVFILYQCVFSLTCKNLNATRI